jgi:hypothetical protein
MAGFVLTEAVLNFPLDTDRPSHGRPDKINNSGANRLRHISEIAVRTALQRRSHQFGQMAGCVGFLQKIRYAD